MLIIIVIKPGMTVISLPDFWRKIPGLNFHQVQSLEEACERFWFRAPVCAYGNTPY